MGFKVSTSKERLTPAKKNIVISNVEIANGRFCDEAGDIIERLEAELPEDLESFDLKITLELAPEEFLDEE